MKKMLKELANNYNLGFINSHEMVTGYREILSTLGAQKELDDICNDILAPLASFLCGIIEGSNKRISDFISETSPKCK